jgi:hypothetical protein
MTCRWVLSELTAGRHAFNYAPARLGHTSTLRGALFSINQNLVVFGGNRKVTATNQKWSPSPLLTRE